VVIPYYRDDRVTIYHGDARDVLPNLPPAGLLVADPPFDLWTDLGDLVAGHESRTVAAFTSFQHRHAVESALGRARVEIVWHFRDGRWVSHSFPRLCHTSILVYGDVGDAYVGDEIHDRTPQRKGLGSVGKDVMAMHTYRPRERKILNSVIEAPRTVADGVWAKPAAVVAPLLAWLADPEQVVIDPFMGGGSVLRAAKDLGIPAIGVELDEAQCEAAAMSMAQEVLW
jgi:site-specific DNA-methyltransferase (adenine-specific)